MNKPETLSWLTSQQNNIDSIIANAALRFHETHQKNENFWYDVRCAQNESYNLSRSKDLCYDRVATPLSYSLWYQARRINTFISHYIDQLIEIELEDHIDLFDLGAGTGAVQMCLGLIYSLLVRENKHVPTIRIFNVDSSPFMLNYNRNLLWPEFFKIYPEAKQIHTEYHLNSWNNPGDVKLTSPWISASYLFDMSDNSDQIKDDFLKLVDTFNPSNLLLLTSDQPKKKQLLNDLVDELNTKGWLAKNESSLQLIFQGEPQKVNSLRRHFSKISGVETLSRYSSWTDGSFISTQIKKAAKSINFDTMRVDVNNINLYNPPLKVRTEITLSDDQKKAARYVKRPTVIIGPAGCGKSVVISERIINTIKAHEGGAPIRILLTTFNKELLKKLAEWLMDLLDSNKYEAIIKNDKDYYGYPNGSATITSKNQTFEIRLIHFDMLAKYLGDIPLRYFNQALHEEILRKNINKVIEEKKVKLQDYINILNTDFLLEEYHRVIYGLQCKLSDGLETYQNISRKGRGGYPSLSKGLRRELVWTVLARYGIEIYQKNLQSFTTRRQLMLHKINNNQISTKFDYIIVDEFQDCTLADFEIFSGLLKDIENLVIAGDIAQAIHVGKSASIPKINDIGRRDVFRLKGSYRLPQRISECILELSRKIKEGSSNDIEEISPYKGSPPGARPIIVFGKDSALLAEKIVNVFHYYKAYGISKITILEKDLSLCNYISSLGVDCETDSVLKLKGLEKECVVWSTSRGIEFEKEIKEFVYTILTRTSCLLIIAFDNNIPDDFLGIFSLLNKERIIFFDQESETNFFEMAKPYVDTFGADED